ncbi:MAG: bacteriorhodopsin [Halobacteriales archaeon]
MPVESAILQASEVAKADITARPEWIWLAIGTAIMGLGTLYFWVSGWGEEDEEARMFYTITTLIPAIAFASYLSMLLGFGAAYVSFGGEERLIYWARYADWLFTTPLLLLDLALLADVDRSTILGLVGADAFMIITGLVGAITTVESYRFIWWAVSDIALVYILYTLYFSLGRKAGQLESESRRTTFRILRNVTIVLWAVYPIWWILGTEGAGAVPLYVETAGFMVLDILAKVGFGLILLRSREAIGAMSSAPEPSADAEPAD